MSEIRLNIEGFYEALPQLVRGKRDRRSNRSAAREIGISFATLSRLENGRDVSARTFVKVCQWLGYDEICKPEGG